MKEIEIENAWKKVLARLSGKKYCHYCDRYIKKKDLAKLYVDKELHNISCYGCGLVLKIY